MRIESSFEFDGDLIVVDAIVVGPARRVRARLVVDTGASLTTISRDIARAAGFRFKDRLARSRVQASVGDERGFIVRIGELHVLGGISRGIQANVADLAYDIDGLIGMNFLSAFNFEIRPAELRILVEPVDPNWLLG